MNTFRCNLKFSLRFCLFSLLVASPLAKSESALDVAKGFNAFIEQGFSSQYTDVQGKLAAGGDITLEGYGTASDLNVAPEIPVLIAGGDISYNNGMIFSGSVLAGGSTDDIADNVKNGMVSGSSIIEFGVLPFSFADEFSKLRGLSQTLAGAENTGSVVSQYGGLTLSGDCSSPLQVFSLDGAILLNSSSFSLECVPSDATVLFNVSGSAPGLQNISLQVLDPLANKTLWNFYQATSVVFAGVGIEGSILAPNADLNTCSLCW